MFFLEGEVRSDRIMWCESPHSLLPGLSPSRSMNVYIYRVVLLSVITMLTMSRVHSSLQHLVTVSHGVVECADHTG